MTVEALKEDMQEYITLVEEVGRKLDQILMVTKMVMSLVGPSL